MARKKKNPIDDAVAAAFNKHGSNIQFNIMDLGKIHDAGVLAAAGGMDAIDAAVIEAIAKYRQN